MPKRITLVFLLLFLTLISFANKTEAKDGNGEKIKDYLKSIENSKKSTNYEETFLLECNTIKEKITKEGMPDYYSGMYIDEGILVINTTDAVRMKKWLKGVINNVEIRSVKYSYDSLKNALDKVVVASMDDEYNTTDSNITGMCIDEKNNKVIIKIRDKNLVTNYSNKYDDDIYSIEYSPEAVLASGTIKAGYHLVNTSGVHFSAGYKAYWTNSTGTTYNGFVTAAHAMAANLLVYTTDYTLVGVCEEKLISPANGVDAAFIHVLYGYTASNQLQYSNNTGSSSGAPYLNYNTIITSFVSGQNISKCGYSTYLTSGTITAGTAYLLLNGQYYYDLVEANTLTAQGDSGGVVFCSSDSVYYKAGIVMAITLDISGSFLKGYYVKAENIENYIGAYAN